jgi:hypothetical protein
MTKGPPVPARRKGGTTESTTLTLGTHSRLNLRAVAFAKSCSHAGPLRAEPSSVLSRRCCRYQATSRLTAPTNQIITNALFNKLLLAIFDASGTVDTLAMVTLSSVGTIPWGNGSLEI